MFKFNKKKKTDTTQMLIENDETLIKIIEVHLDMISKLRENDNNICEIVTNQQKAIRDLQNQINELQNLINQS